MKTSNILDLIGNTPLISIRNENIVAFVSGLGSGGTLQGVASFLKKHKPNVKIYHRIG